MIYSLNCNPNHFENTDQNPIFKKNVWDKVRKKGKWRKKLDKNLYRIIRPKEPDIKVNTTRWSVLGPDYPILLRAVVGVDGVPVGGHRGRDPRHLLQNHRWFSFKGLLLLLMFCCCCLCFVAAAYVLLLLLIFCWCCWCFVVGADVLLLLLMFCCSCSYS